MIAINPLDITGGTFTSTVPEPDTARGEVEWVDPEVLTTFGSYSGSYFGAALANDGFIYCVGDTGTVLKLDPVSQTVSTFGSYTGEYNSATLANNGDIYCVGRSGEVLKIDVSAQTVSTFGSYTGFYLGAALASNGDIYCVGNASAGSVLRIDVSAQTVSTLGSYTELYSAIVAANDGNIYCVGGTSVLKIEMSTQTVSSFGAIADGYFTATLASDQNIYCIGRSGTVLKIDVLAQSVSTFGSYTGIDFHADAALSSDGLIYCVGDTNAALKVDINSRSVTRFGSNSGNYYTATLSNEGDIYCVGSTGAGDVLKITQAYKPEEKAILTSTHREYQAAVYTKDNPSDGVLKVPPTWIDIGPTNKYAMFDDEVQTATVGASPIVITSTPGIIANGLAMFNVNGASNINVTVNSAASGEVYNKDIDMNNSTNVTDAWTYYFTPIIRIDRFVLLDIPPYNDATITVTLTGTGDISAGVLALGPQISIGVANYNTEIQLLDFSTRERDTFGNFKTVKRAIADLVKFDVTIPKANVSYVRNQFKSLSQIPTVWVGGGGGVDDPTLVYGYYENFVNNISSPSITKSTITIQGVV